MAEMVDSDQQQRERRWLAGLGLNRPELRAWAMYDWANSAMVTTILVTVFPIYFIQVAGAGSSGAAAGRWWPLINSLSTAIVAVISPVLGAMADYRAARKRMLGMCIGVGVAAVAPMYFIYRGDLLLAAMLFLLSSVAVNTSFVFYESLLPHIARENEIDRVSTAGYAMGYVGGGLLLALNLLWITKPQWFGLPSGPDLSDSQATLPARLSFLSVAVWWLVFSLPLFRRVPEPPRLLEPDESKGGNSLLYAFSRLSETFHELRRYKQAFLMLLAYLIYNDGIATIHRMAVAYGTTLKIDQGALISAILLVQFVGIPFTVLFGMAAGWIGAKRSVLIGLAVFVGIAIFGYFMQTARDFFILAILVGMVQGGTQALSRSMFATMVPRHKSSEFFGFYSVFSKFAGIFGPLLFAGMSYFAHSERAGILSVVILFVIGGVLLLFVNEEEGARTARTAESHVQAAESSPP